MDTVALRDLAHAVAYGYLLRHPLSLFELRFEDRVDDRSVDAVLLAILLGDNYGCKLEQKRAMTFHQQMKQLRRSGYWKYYQRAVQAGNVARQAGIPLPRFGAGNVATRYPVDGGLVVEVELLTFEELAEDGVTFAGSPTGLVYRFRRPTESDHYLIGPHAGDIYWQLDQPWNPDTDHADGLMPELASIIEQVAQLRKEAAHA